MSAAGPLVSVGIPVYNGEKFLEAALDSILGQTYRNLEIIIFDNASTDRTASICETHAAKDPRVRYFRNAENLGAAKNYNLTVENANGRYFKWAAHDDVCAPTFIERCIQVLEQEPTVAVAYPKTLVIDERSSVTNRFFEDLYNIRGSEPHERFKQFTRTPLDCNAVFGVIRLDLLRKTPCIGAYESSDRVLLGELTLLGEIAEIPERLFLRRYHDKVSTFACTTKKSMAAWFDPKSSGKFTRLRRFVEYIRTLNRVPLNTSQWLYCFWYLMIFYVKLYLQPSRWSRVAKHTNSRIAHALSYSFSPYKEPSKKEAY